MRTLLAPLTLALALAFPQDPKEPQVPHRPVFEGAALESARIRTEILGAWQLTRGEIPDLGASGSGVAGYALILEGYLSLEVHVLGNTAPDSENTFFQTGTHRWKLDDEAHLETYGLIGTHNITDDEEDDFEPPGLRREYNVELAGDRLVLERVDGKSRLTFMRLGKLPFPGAKEGGGLDFYGRPIKPKAEGEKPKGG
jgi:hypothetical protein